MFGGKGIGMDGPNTELDAGRAGQTYPLKNEELM